MKKNTKIMLGLSAAILTTIIFIAVRGRNKRRILNRVAEEGYETAHDVLYPQQNATGKKLHFGPVIPS